MRQACGDYSVVNCVYLFFSWATIGYGYKLYRAFIWSAFFIVSGALVARRTPEVVGNVVQIGRLAYSFDTFLPLIKLRKRHDDIDIISRARYYFYVHKIAGWVLGSFLVAAITGLTK
jgi:hypothetical protein